MITRIVKMTFKPEYIDGFKEIFQVYKKQIRAFDGCSHVDLLKDLDNECVFFTLSFWNTEDDLNAYRESYIFKNTWSKLKPMFSEKAEAWSLIST
jgi:(4S)-4-hydroxy-5-phosphonooxypentane-2,3-dione isomerase